MRELLRLVALVLIAALSTTGCAQLRHFRIALDTQPQLEAWGPGTVFQSIEAAAVDALVYTYLQARGERDLERMRAGTIYREGDGYSYGEIHAANNVLIYRITYPLTQQDVARFHMYPFASDRAVNRANEQATRADRRSVTATDPMHRPLFILHPSLVIREYGGTDGEAVEVADLRHPTPELLFAGE